MIAGILSAAQRREAEDHSSETPIDHAVMDEVEEVPDEMPPSLSLKHTLTDILILSLRLTGPTQEGP